MGIVMSYDLTPQLPANEKLEVPVRLLLDVGAVKTGGGVQLALNFLDPFLNSVISKGWDPTLLLPSNGLLADYRHPACTHYLRSPDNSFKRLWFEHQNLRRHIKLKKISVVFTFFGFGLPKLPGVFSLVSMANATTCYPESHFWRYLPLLPKIKKQLYNSMRLNRLSQADHLILETTVMQTRINASLKRNVELSSVALPSPSIFIPELPVKAYSSTTLKFLILSGLDFHKNLWRLPEICTYLKSVQNRSIRFVISCAREAFVHTYGLDLRHQDFDDYIEFRGAIPQREIAQAYRECDILLNLSDLESFSNNYMEAWKSGMAQVCSDRDFARYICQDSAIYVEPHDPKTVAEQLVTLAQQPQTLEQCALEGKRRLASLPSLATRIAAIIEFIESARVGTPHMGVSNAGQNLRV